MTPEEKQSGIPCALVGTDGNIYALLGRVWSEPMETSMRS